MPPLDKTTCDKAPLGGVQQTGDERLKAVSENVERLELFLYGCREESFTDMGKCHLVKDRQQVTRISPLIAARRFELDGAREIPALKGLGDFEARKAEAGDPEASVSVHNLERIDASRGWLGVVLRIPAFLRA
jgi:hypothetical protein